MASIFTKIVNGEIPSYKVAEDENFYAFLDINPLAKGHTLVIPKKEVDYIFDLDDETYNGLFKFAKRVGQSIELRIPCKRLGMVVYGLDVPHVHIHLIPLQGVGNEINFSNPKVKLSDQEFKSIAEKIAEAFEI
ncbi:MAG TPA: HIT family protein [Bacteroidales bacterium]|nr:HIT family protein [Bacteroidales bacterium]HPE57441.1 HIT family protein [Bacteroidales bacterium]